MSEASDREREMIRKEKSQPSEASIKDYDSEDKTAVAKTAIDETKIEYTEVKPPTEEESQQEEHNDRLDVTAAAREGEAGEGSEDTMQDKVIKAPRDGAEKEDSTSGTA